MLTTIEWKNQNKDISYAKCSKTAAICEISTLNIKENALTPEINSINSDYLRKFTWSDDFEYIAYIAQKPSTEKDKEGITSVADLRLKSGSVDVSLGEIPTADDPTNTTSKVINYPK